MAVSSRQLQLCQTRTKTKALKRFCRESCVIAAVISRPILTVEYYDNEEDLESRIDRKCESNQ